MKKVLWTLGCIIAAVLLWIIVPEEKTVEVIDCGNSMQLMKRTISFGGQERIRYGLRKNGTDLLAPVHQMVENEYLKLRVFYGMNAKIHVFDTETGENVLTGRIRGHRAETVWFCLDDEQKQDSYLLLARYKAAVSSVQIKTDTIAVFDVKNGKTILVK